MVIVAKRRQTSGKLECLDKRLLLDTIDGGKYIRRQIEPALLPVALEKIASNGPAGFSMTLVTSPATSSKQVKKIKPVKTPIATQASMMRGPSTVGFGISSTFANWLASPSVPL